MKKDLHPTDYRDIVYQDLNNGETFITKSTAKTDETIVIEGTTYPLVKVHISSASHPFYTGLEKLVDVEGRVDRFKARQDAADKKKAALSSKAAKKAARKKTEDDEDDDASPQKLGGGTNKKPVAETKAPKQDKPAETPVVEEVKEKPVTEEAAPEAEAADK